MSPDEINENQQAREQANAPQVPYPQHEPEQELYLQHLMNMMVDVMDRGFQKS
jgi:hypothetical protein